MSRVAFRERRGPSLDLFEGGFHQSVIPNFGVHPRARDAASWLGEASEISGLGRYAFSAGNHLTETHALNSNSSARKLLGEWAYNWNLSRSVLIQRTPSHMIASRLVQSLLAPSATFLFVTRHPLAVSLAHRHWGCCTRMTLASLNLHWIASHRMLAYDLPHLRAARVIRYEDLALRTRSCFSNEVLHWLQLARSVDIPRMVNAHANQRHEEHLCRILHTPAQLQRHCAMAAALQPALDEFQLGYDLRRGNFLGFSCLQRVLANLSRLPCETVPATPWVVKLLAKPYLTLGAASTPSNGLPATKSRERSKMTPMKDMLLCATPEPSTRSSKRARTTKAKRMLAKKAQQQASVTKKVTNKVTKKHKEAKRTDKRNKAISRHQLGNTPQKNRLQHGRMKQDIKQSITGFRRHQHKRRHAVPVNGQQTEEEESTVRRSKRTHTAKQRSQHH